MSLIDAEPSAWLEEQSLFVGGSDINQPLPFLSKVPKRGPESVSNEFGAEADADNWNITVANQRSLRFEGRLIARNG